MRFFCTALFLAATALRLAAQDFASELTATVQNLEKNKTAGVAGIEGWLFFGGELRLVSLGPFWGEDAAKVSRAHKAELADPVPAILDFHQQLKARGIELLVVPVPPKAAIYPDNDVRAIMFRPLRERWRHKEREGQCRRANSGLRGLEHGNRFPANWRLRQVQVGTLFRSVRLF